MNQFKLNSNIQQFKSYTPQLPYISSPIPSKHFRYEIYAELQKELFNKKGNIEILFQRELLANAFAYMNAKFSSFKMSFCAKYLGNVVLFTAFCQKFSHILLICAVNCAKSVL